MTTENIQPPIGGKEDEPLHQESAHHAEWPSTSFYEAIFGWPTERKLTITGMVLRENHLTRQSHSTDFARATRAYSRGFADTIPENYTMN
jgi:hypothetical protein